MYYLLSNKYNNSCYYINEIYICFDLPYTGYFDKKE